MKNPFVRQIICLSFCCCFAFASKAQVKDFVFPSIPQTGESINDFIPDGWKLKDTLWVILIRRNERTLYLSLNEGTHLASKIQPVLAVSRFIPGC